MSKAGQVYLTCEDAEMRWLVSDDGYTFRSLVQWVDIKEIPVTAAYCAARKKKIDVPISGFVYAYFWLKQKMPADYATVMQWANGVARRAHREWYDGLTFDNDRHADAVWQKTGPAFHLEARGAIPIDLVERIFILTGHNQHDSEMAIAKWMAAA